MERYMQKCYSSNGQLFVDLDGNEIERTPYKYPYNYDGYVVYKSTEYKKLQNKSVDSDRLTQWDQDKDKRCKIEAFGRELSYFDNCSIKSIEKYLRLYFNKQITLTAIMKHCNVSNGYPYWQFVFKEN